jgi:hypothetical protein
VRADEASATADADLLAVSRGDSEGHTVVDVSESFGVSVRAL